MASPVVQGVIAYYRHVLRSCALGVSPPTHAQQLHAELHKSGILLSSSNICSAIFHMYAACGPPSSAVRALVDVRPAARTAADWTALISCHNAHALPASALRLFRCMRRAGVPPDQVSLLAVLSAAARLADSVSAATAHNLFLKLGLPFATSARNAVMNCYAKSGCMVEVRRMFDEVTKPTVVSWTILLSGALRLEGLDVGMEVFDQMPERNEVASTVMVSAYIEAGYPRNALSLISKMIFGDSCSTSFSRSLNHISLCSILSACSQAGDLTVGRWVHGHILKSADASEGEHALVVETALVDMYGKCGRADTAGRLFEASPNSCNKNVVAWNTILSVMSMHGLGIEVLCMFIRMVDEARVPPDDITFVSVLSACSRSGLLEEGRKLFGDLEGRVYGLSPKIEHYACMVDLLGKAGMLDAAEELVMKMPMRPNKIVLGSLLSSCSIHGKLELGRRLMQRLSELDPSSREHHILFSNMQNRLGRSDEAGDVREELKKEGLRKIPGISFIEIDGIVHKFCAGDKSHNQTLEVYKMLDHMSRRLRLVGYIPDAASQISRNYSQDGDESEEREQALQSHSERLAIALGLISTKPGLPLRIFKNLRICPDCHTAVKLLSHIYNREIIIRDRNRFHRFSLGSCSCSDYW